MTRKEAIKILLDAAAAAENESLASISECEDALLALDVTEDEIRSTKNYVSNK